MHLCSGLVIVLVKSNRSLFLTTFQLHGAQSLHLLAVFNQCRVRQGYSSVLHHVQCHTPCPNRGLWLSRILLCLWYFRMVVNWLGFGAWEWKQVTCPFMPCNSAVPSSIQDTKSETTLSPAKETEWVSSSEPDYGDQRTTESGVGWSTLSQIPGAIEPDLGCSLSLRNQVSPTLPC